MKKQIKITKENIIKRIARQTNKNISDAKLFYNTLENIIFEIIKSTNEEQDICIKLFEGINFEGNYISENLQSYPQITGLNKSIIKLTSPVPKSSAVVFV